MITNQEIKRTYRGVPPSPYYDLIPVAEEKKDRNKRFGSDILHEVKELQVGFGSSVFRSDRQGIWLGAKTFAEAAASKFAVDMEGNLYASSVTITGVIEEGGAAADVNANPTTIDGSKITDNTIASSKIISIIETKIVLKNLASAPSSPSNGEIYYDTGTHKAMLRENGAWKTITTT